jgi:hypothetical protein
MKVLLARDTVGKDPRHEMMEFKEWRNEDDVKSDAGTE